MAKKLLYNELENHFGFANRVFSMQILRPFLGIEMEKKYRNSMQPYENAVLEYRKKGDKSALDSRLKELHEARENFFKSSKKSDPSMFTLEDMQFSFALFSYVTSLLFNRVCSIKYSKLISGEGDKNSAETERNIKKVLSTSFIYKKKEYVLWDRFEKRYSEYITGISRKIDGLFTSKKRKDYMIGEASIPNAKHDFPIPFYLSATKNGGLVSFYGVNYEKGVIISGDPGEVEIDDYIVKLRVPVLNKTNVPEDDKNANFLDRFDRISFSDVSFIIKTRNVLRKSRDDSTNALVKDFITGNIKNRVKEFINLNEEKIAVFVKQSTSDSKDVDDDQGESGNGEDIDSILKKALFKWSGISTYEIVRRKAGGKNSWFFHLTCNVLPKKETLLSENVAAGIDFCFSRSHILQLSIVDLESYRKDPSRIQSWVFGEMEILDREYHLRRMYNEFYTSMKMLQKNKEKRRKSGDSIPKVQVKFENKRKYFIGKVVKDITTFCISRKVSKVYVENLKGLRDKENWFTVNRIRNFPVLHLLDKLEMKLADAGIVMERINPKNTSRTCPVCGAVNDAFNFDYRLKNHFPVFTCRNPGCRYAIESPGRMDEHFRQADLNAASCIALYGAGVLERLKEKIKKTKPRKIINKTEKISAFATGE